MVEFNSIRFAKRGEVSRLSWPYRLILHEGRLHSMKQCVLLDMLESWLHVMFPHLTGCKNVTFPIFISLSLSLSLSLSYTLLGCWAFTQPPICITWSRLFRSFNPWFSHTTHWYKALFLNIIKNTTGNYLPCLSAYLPIYPLSIYYIATTYLYPSYLISSCLLDLLKVVAVFKYLNLEVQSSKK